MAVIGGIFNTDGQPCDNGVMIDMSRAMLARGGARREAYVNRGISVFSGYNFAERERDGMIYCCESEKGKNIVVVLDGDVYADNAGEDGRFPFCDKKSGKIIADSYLKYGTEFFRHLFGEYSFVLWDEERGEIYLLRDGQGSRPLFYAIDGRNIAFASEIKGVARSLSGDLSVEIGRLRAYVFSDGLKSGGELYSYIYEIPPSGGCVCSRIGINRFLYSGKREADEGRYSREVIDCAFVCPDEEKMKDLLGEILFAFDHPQFDIFMPTFIEQLTLLRERRGRQGVAIADATMCMDINYSVQRRDRLSAMVGVLPICVPPLKNELRERDLKKMERILQNILSECDMMLVCSLFGENWQSIIRKERNIAKRIRMEAMIYQTTLWYKNFNVSFL